VATCPSCGKEQSGASAFCAACGSVLDRPATDAALPEPPIAPTQIIPPHVAHVVQQHEDFGDIGQYIARRLTALIVDLAGITVLLASGIQFLLMRLGQDPHSYGAFFASSVYTLVALFIYLCITEGFLGTTLGKALFGLRVVAVNGGRVGVARAVVRNIFLPFDLLGLGFILATLTPRRRRIGDFVAGTEVVNAHTGVVGPAIAALVLGGWGYAEYAYADGLRMAQTLSGEAQTYGPSMVGGQPTPSPGPTPLPERTPVPTEQPITIPTIAPTGAPTPAGSADTAPVATPPKTPSASTPRTTPAATSAPGAQATTVLPSVPGGAAATTVPASPTPASSPTTT